MEDLGTEDLGTDVREAVVTALRFAEGLRETGASTEDQAQAVIEHLLSSGFMIRPRVRGEHTRVRRLELGAAVVTSVQVRDARAALRLSRSKLARIAGIDYGTLRDFESGRKVPQQRTLDAIIAALEQAARPASSPARSGNP